MADIAFDIIGRDRASVAFRNVGKSAQQANRQVTGFGTSLKDHVGKFAALTAGSLGAGALIGFAKSAIDTEKSYSTSMRTIKVATNATGAQMDKLNKQAIDLGQKTVYSAGDAASAMLELGKAGQNSAQIMKTVPQVMNLAATEGMGLADAAGVVTSALAQFGLNARKSAVVVNALAGASNASKASVASMSEALNYSGAASHAVGLSVQQTAGALAALAQHGQEGSMAGTSLSSVFNHLQPQTTKAATTMEDLGLKFVKANGSFKSIAQIAQILQVKLGGLTPAARKADISAIFGRNAGSIAAVLALMNEGAKGINKYTKASSDLGAAARLSGARMNGTAGAIEQLNGSIDTAKLKLGQALAPAVIKTSNYLAQHLVPAMDDTISFSKDLGDTLNGTVIPPLKVAGGLVLDVAKVFGGLPGPLKSVGIEAGIAALVFPRLSAGVTSATTAIKDQITYARVLRLELAEGARAGNFMQTAMTSMGAQIKAAAGVGGMVALTQASQTSNRALAALMDTAGGAAIGFSMGGPLGAALGGAAGALLGIAKASQTARVSAIKGLGVWQDYANTLNDVTAASTEATRQLAYQKLQESGAFDITDKLGIARTTLLNATLGNVKSETRLNAALNAGTAALIQKRDALAAGIKEAGDAPPSAQRELDELNARIANIQAIQHESATVKQAVKEKRTEIATIKNIPRRVSTYYTTPGADKSLGELKALVRQYHLQPKQIRTVMQLYGIDTTKQQFKSLVKVSRATQMDVQKNSRDAGSAWAQFFGQGATASKGKVDNSLSGLVLGSTKSATGKASGAGAGLGANYAQGYVNGINAKTSAAYSAGFSLGSAAKRGTQAAQKSNSPSKVAYKLGGDFGDGYHGGLRASSKGAMSAGAALVESLVKGIDQHKVRAKDVLDKLTKYIGDQTQKINDLVSKRQGIIGQVQGFASSVFGATFQDAQGNDRAGSISDLLTFATQQRDQQVQLQDDIAALAKNHISKNLLDQLLNEGSAGIANIHILAGGTAQQIAQFNALNAQTLAAGAAGGNTISSALGINSQIASAEHDKAVGEAMANRLDHILRAHAHQHVTVEVYLDGHQVHTVLLKERQKKRAGLGLG
jgi:TP901 family phage tail tape measure protein